MLIQLGIVLIAHLLVLTESMFATIILSKQLYIPGKKWSVLNISQNIESLAREYYVNISLQLTQLAAGEQGNSVFDCFVLPLNTADYSESVACYTEAVQYLNGLYEQFEPCQGGCSFNTTSYLKNTGFETVIATSNGTGGDTSIIIDNTFFPCEGGVYQSEVYLYETLTLTIETNLGYQLLLKIVCVILLQVLVFLFAYVTILIGKLHDKKKVLVKVKHQKEAQQVLDEFNQN